MASVLGVSLSGYYRFLEKPESARTLENKRLLFHIRTIYKESDSTYGSPRIHAALLAKGESCSRKRVARLMKHPNIQAKMYKKCKKTTNQSDKPYYRGEDLVKQHFYAQKPNRLWVSDISYIKVKGGFAYLSVILDLFSRKVVGMALRDNMKTDLIIEALNQALLQRKPPSGLIHHSDLGSQYTSRDFYNKAKKHKIQLSYGKTGCAYDNAVMESFFHTLKTECTYFKNYQTLEEAKMDIFTYIFTFYNSKRRHSTLKYQTPNQVENHYYINLSVSV